LDENKTLELTEVLLEQQEMLGALVSAFDRIHNAMFGCSPDMEATIEALADKIIAASTPTNSKPATEPTTNDVN
jgi:hypothetical protein